MELAVIVPQIPVIYIFPFFKFYAVFVVGAITFYSNAKLYIQNAGERVPFCPLPSLNKETICSNVTFPPLPFQSQDLSVCFFTWSHQCFKIKNRNQLENFLSGQNQFGHSNKAKCSLFCKTNLTWIISCLCLWQS